MLYKLFSASLKIEPVMKRNVCLAILVLAMASCHFSQPLPTRIPFSTQVHTSITQPTQNVTVTPYEVTSVLGPMSTSTASPTMLIVPTTLPTATLTNTPTVTATFAPLNIRYEGIYSVPPEMRVPIMKAMQAEQQFLLGESEWIVSAYRAIPGWAKVVLVPQRFVNANWEYIETLTPYVIEVMAYEDTPFNWQAFLLNGAIEQGMQSQIPEDFVNVVSEIPELAGAYQFPWMARQGWWAVQGWHGGNAIDFQPAYDVGYSVVAAEAGYLREICRDGYQSLLQITHADGNVTYYLHVQPSRTLRQSLLDQPVQRGQYLGELTRNPPFNYACGRGLSRHLHFVSSDPHLIIQGHELSDIADVATCCRDVPIFVSENERID